MNDYNFMSEERCILITKACLNGLYEIGLRQKDIAKLLKVTDRTIRKWENGWCMPRADTFYNLRLLCKEEGAKCRQG